MILFPSSRHGGATSLLLIQFVFNDTWPPFSVWDGAWKSRPLFIWWPREGEGAWHLTMTRISSQPLLHVIPSLSHLPLQSLLYLPTVNYWIKVKRQKNHLKKKKILRLLYPVHRVSSVLYSACVFRKVGLTANIFYSPPGWYRGHRLRRKSKKVSGY